MHIAVDAMGGDHAPRAVVEGAVAALADSGVRLILVGKQDLIEAELIRLGAQRERIEIVDAEEVVGMDEPAITPIRKKRRSSIRLCAQLVREERAQALVSAGNTGATMIAAKMVMGTIAGVDRPALAGLFPNRAASHTVLLDVGANVGSKSSHLREFAVMGHFYAQELLQITSPRVGLLSIGEEEVKGTELTREVYKVLETTGLNFIGNVEGTAVFDGSVDVIVCDGFVGNVVLKASESVVSMMLSKLKEELDGTPRTRLGRALAAPALRKLRQMTDYRESGGVPLLGLKGGCFVAHGRSEVMAIKNMILRAAEFCEAEMPIKIRDKVAELHLQEERLLGQSQPQEVPAQ
jgi:glycerol-3-phosphate acyltransferase PlsX